MRRDEEGDCRLWAERVAPGGKSAGTGPARAMASLPPHLKRAPPLANAIVRFAVARARGIPALVGEGLVCLPQPLAKGEEQLLLEAGHIVPQELEIAPTNHH